MLGGFGTVRLAVLKTPEKESGNISEELDDIIPERSRLKNTKGRKISKSIEHLPDAVKGKTTKNNSDVIMKIEENDPQEESKFGKGRSSSPEEDTLMRSKTFVPEHDQEMFALKIISKSKVLESRQ